jgi:lysophospholipase L1-like esterase
MSVGWLYSALLFSSLAAAATDIDFPWIRKFASIGDSYAAGLGAADRMDWACSRYGGAYPNLLHASYLGNSTERTHQFLACSGATTSEVIEKQVPVLEDDIDLLTISAGGNDVGLTPVLNNCIYRFYMAGDCETALEDGHKKIADKENLEAYMEKLLDAVKPKMNKKHGIAYVTGYASFFGADDHVCDNVTWAVWGGAETSKPYLKLEMRRKLNAMVRSVNTVLRHAVEAAGPKFRFIDYDNAITQAEGRYCEAGVVEPDPNRKGLDFYEWNTVDTGESADILQLTGDDVPAGSFEAYIAESINMTLLEHPDWEFDPDKGFVNKSKVRPDGVVEDIIWWMLPDGWKRVFHLRPGAHAVIAQMVVDDLTREREARLDEMAQLIFLGAATLGAIVMILLLVSLCRRRKPYSCAPIWGKKESAYIAVDEDDDDATTIAEPDEALPTTAKQYNTFN